MKKIIALLVMLSAMLFAANLYADVTVDDLIAFHEDGYTAQIVKIDSENGIRSYGTAPVFDANGNLFMAGPFHYNITRIDSNGNETVILTTPTFCPIQSISMDDKGNMYLTMEVFAPNIHALVKISGFSREIEQDMFSSYLTADVDGSGVTDEIQIQRYGIWIYYDWERWERIHDKVPESTVVGDIDGDGEAELIMDFGKDIGLWIYHHGGTWVQLHNISPESMVIGDIDGDGMDDVIFDFGPLYGIWIYGDESWRQLHPLSSVSISAKDLDDNGNFDLLIDFGPKYGTWMYYNDSVWTQVPLEIQT